jgi:CBS domain containing-hemolysin-like protein
VIWVAVAVGLLVTIFGASSTAALLTVSSTALAEAVSRRLRGNTESLDWLYEAERELSGAAATTGLGVALLAAGLSAVVGVVTGALPVWAVALLLVAVAIPFVLFSGYLLPRWLTERRANRVAELVRPVLGPWSRLLTWLLPEPVRRHAADVRAVWREGAAGALAASEELVMVGNVIAFAQRVVRDVMTPRTELVAIPEEAGYDEITQAFLQSGYSRLPVYRGTIDEIVGMVHVFDLLKIKPGDPVPIRPVGAAPATRSCGDVLLDMQRERRHLAVVLDEFGGTLGIVTLEDLLEAMVGEIFDEHDESAERRAPEGPELWEADGSAPASELEQRFGVGLPPGSSRTVGGRLVELAGRVPRAGERFTLRGLELVVLAAAATRIERLLVRRTDGRTASLDREGG